MKPTSIRLLVLGSQSVSKYARPQFHRLALYWLCLAILLPGWIAVAQEKAPWIQTPEERAEFLHKKKETQAAPRETPQADAKSVRPTDEALTRMRTELAALKTQLADLPKDEFGLPPADAAIYAEAVELQLKTGEWGAPFNEPASFTCLKWGRAVAAGLKADPNFMKGIRHLAPVGYRSKVDRSAQPYMVLLPEDFDPAASGPYRLIVTLHGFYAPLCPVGSIASTPGRLQDLNPGAITVCPFGRANNWYAWAGESDVWDVIADVKKRFPIDDNQIVLTGFSMGGGGAVTLGLTHPGPFAAISPLAPAVFDFDVIPSAKDLPMGSQRWAPLTEEEIGKRVARVYAGPGLAENGLGVPLMLGVGGADNLLKAQESLSKAFDAVGVKYSSYVVPGVGHAGGAVTAQPEYRPFLLAHTRDSAPHEITFATTTLKSSSRAWVTIEGLTAHYTKAIIHVVADPEKGTLTVTTDGIERFSLNPPESLAPRGKTVVSVDGNQIKLARNAPGAALTFEKADGKWRQAKGAAPALAKKPGLQGPIADAFTRGFLCVRPTGKSWNEAVNNHAVALLEALRTRWRARLFGELPVKADTEVTEDDCARYDLVLFGDPGSNRLIAEALSEKSPWKIPLRWEKDSVGFGTNTFAASSHLPALIYPSPLHTGRYVVFNGVPLARAGGPTRERDRIRSDTLPASVLPTVLGDFAILEIDPAKADQTVAKSVYGGFFNEQWK